MTISGDRYNRRRRHEREDSEPKKRFTEQELKAQGYVRADADEWHYETIDGDLLYRVRCWRHPNIPHDKQFRQGRGQGEWLESDAGCVKVPYRWWQLDAADHAKPVYWPEGEKDCETLASHGQVASTAAGQVISATIAKAMTGRHVVILPDNDDIGEDNAADAADAFRHYAASLKVVRLPRLQRGEDVTDWLDKRGGSLEELERIVADEPCIIAEAQRNAVRNLPFSLEDHSQIPRREWLYKPAYIRGNVSVTAGAGARGKSTMIVAEALAMVSGKPLLGVQPPKQLNVWYVNFEDDADELKRRFNAAATYFELTPADIGERLIVDSGQLVIAAADEKGRVKLNQDAITTIRRTIREKKIDVAIFDPFVSMHRVSENDNGAIDMVTKALKDLGCAVMLVHHTRKPNGDAGGVDDARGASALVNAARYVRVLNPMAKDEAEKLGVDPEKRGFYFSAADGKTNLTPPAESRDWFKLESFELGNGGGFEIDGDNVGVVTRFAVAASQQGAELVRDLTQMDVVAAFRVGGPWRERGTSDVWAGYKLAHQLRVGAESTDERKVLQKAIAKALREGWLETFEGEDSYRNKRSFVRLAPLVGGGAGETGGAT